MTEPMTAEEEAEMRARHRGVHDIRECDGCAVFSIIDALRARIANLEAKRASWGAHYERSEAFVLVADAMRSLVRDMANERERCCNSCRCLACLEDHGCDPDSDRDKGSQSEEYDVDNCDRCALLREGADYDAGRVALGKT